MSDVPGSEPWGAPPPGPGVPPPGPAQPPGPPPGVGQPPGPPPGVGQPQVPQQPYGQVPQQPYGQPQPGQPAFGQPQPGFGAPAAPKRNLKPWFIGCGGAALLGLLLCGGGAFWLAQKATEPIDRANDLMSRVEDGDYDGARDLVNDDCRGAEAVIDGWEQNDIGPDFSDRSLSSVRNSNGVVSVSGTIELNGDERDLLVIFSDGDPCNIVLGG